MDDLISRKQAVEAINRYGSVWMEYTEDMSVDEIAERALKASKQSMVKILHDLSPAQPEIVRCKDCKFTDGEKPIADGRYWCVLHESFMYFCSDAERGQ